MIRIVIAEDHQALIDGIKLMIEYEPDIEVVGEANDGEELLKPLHNKCCLLLGNSKKASESCEVILTCHNPLHLSSKNIRLRVATHVNKINLKSISEAGGADWFFSTWQILAAHIPPNTD